MNTHRNTFQSAEALTITAAYRVAGMSCGHCERAIVDEIGNVEGVTEVRVDLPGGGVTVRSDRPIARQIIETAVYEAGCTLL